MPIHDESLPRSPPTLTSLPIDDDDDGTTPPASPTCLLCDLPTNKRSRVESPRRLQRLRCSHSHRPPPPAHPQLANGSLLVPMYGGGSNSFVLRSDNHGENVRLPSGPDVQLPSGPDVDNLR